MSEKYDFDKIGEEIQIITRKWFDPMDEPTLVWKNEKPLWASRFPQSGVRFSPAHEKLNEIEGSPFSIAILVEQIDEYTDDLDMRVSDMKTDLVAIVSGNWNDSVWLDDVETGPAGPREFQYHAFFIVFETEKIYNSSDF